MNWSDAEKKEKRHQEDLDRLRSFRPMDDTFMRGLFKENLPLAELVLRIITGKPDLILTKCETQADMKRVTGARSICLDAYATDSAGKKYDIEVQRADNGADPHRARYHSSVMDVENLDEKQDYKEVGVYDPQDIQKKINEQCLQMEPIVRPLLTVAQKDGKAFVSAEIPGVDLTDRPVFYKGKGRLKGSYTRVGDSDEPMTEYEVYSYEAYRKKYQDDIRGVQRATLSSLNKEKLALYIDLLKSGKPNLSNMDDESIYELMSVTRNNEITLSATMIFSPYPQAYFPQLCITAIAVPGTEIGCIGDSGERFLDNQRIEGNISEMLDEAISFVKRNMKNKTIINPETGVREDRTDYPITAVREAIVNALVHRDYSIHTEGMPIQIIMYEDRMEIKNPGGIYGRIKVDQLGKMQPDIPEYRQFAEKWKSFILENRSSQTREAVLQ